MSDLFMRVLAGLLVVIISGAGGYLLRKIIYPEGSILPDGFRRRAQETYSHLSGEWHQYYLTYDTSVGPDPIWLHGIQEVGLVGKYRIEGCTRLTDHPSSELQYVIHGEIRTGRLIITDSCVQDETEFASIIFPDLRSGTKLIGIWVGRDNNLHLIGAPVVWSRVEMSADQLNRAAERAPMHLVPIGVDYELYIPSKEVRTLEN